ncbi:hypothetical protein BJ508DRAFT_380508 [Ascobolus immersus RN42]|uniref:Uncharacterized protein n=1 Tax=Ascobolus immersus RN42 TaxID=1160509 RepID=A0A3N4HRA5_ASCIM|nr:hypothetical protein BJ508DRAFT_380508 [Ascobolus immersus RN42]
MSTSIANLVTSISFANTRYKVYAHSQQDSLSTISIMLDNRYDMIFCISGEALQDQIRFFFNDVEIPGVGRRTGYGAGKTKPKKYLIEHDLVLEGSGEHIQHAKLDAQIDCPEIILQDGQTAKMTLRFPEDGSKWKVKNSKLTYKTNEGAPTTVSVNGTSVSWITSISSRQIQNIKEELIRPSEDSSSSACLAEETEAQMRQIALSETAFNAASVFCLFEASRVASSLEVIHHGEKLDENSDTFKAFKAVILRYCESHDKDPAVPSKSSPFVLGYGITQTPESLRNLDPSKPAPPVQLTAFSPRSFQIITSGQTERHPRGVLAYGIHTHADGNIENDNALISVRQVMERMTKSYHGILTMSPRLLMHELIEKSLMPRLLLNPQKVADDRVGHRLGLQNKTTFGSKRDALSVDFGYNWHSYKQDKVVLIYNNEYWFKGSTGVDASLWSKSLHADQNGYVLTTDAEHTAFITLKTCQQYDSIEDGAGWGYSTKVVDKLLLSYKAVLEVTTSQSGCLSFRVDSSTHLPHFNGEGGIATTKVDREDGFPNPSENWGCWHYEYARNFTSAPGTEITGGYVPPSRLPELQALSSDAVKTVADSLQNGLEGLRSLVVMPGGHVFAFNGFDTDVNGRGWTRVTYKSVTTGEQEQ